MTEPEITLSDVLDRYPLMYNRDDRGDFTEQDLAQHREINRQWWASLKLDTKMSEEICMVGNNKIWSSGNA